MSQILPLNTSHLGWCSGVASACSHERGQQTHSLVSQLWTNETKPFNFLPHPPCQILMPTSNEVSSNNKTLISTTKSDRNTKKSAPVLCRINLSLMLQRTEKPDALRQELSGQLNLQILIELFKEKCGFHLDSFLVKNTTVQEMKRLFVGNVSHTKSGPQNDKLTTSRCSRQKGCGNTVKYPS